MGRLPKSPGLLISLINVTKHRNANVDSEVVVIDKIYEAREIFSLTVSGNDSEGESNSLRSSCIEPRMTFVPQVTMQVTRLLIYEFGSLCWG